MNIIESLKWRYATKKFDPNKKLTPQQLNTLKEAFNLTATSFGLQPMKMVVVSNQKIKTQLLEHSYYQNQVIDASHLLVLCVQKSLSHKDVDTYFDLEKETRGTDKEIIDKYSEQLKGILSGKSEEAKKQSAINQAYIALGNLMTVCALKQIDACPMEGFESSKYDKVLDLDSKNLTSVLLLPVGFRAEDDFMANLKKVRKSMDETIINIE